MKKLLLAMLMCAFIQSAFAQKIYFLYVQTENQQPFFVRLDERIYSSSSLGYVIIPKLKDSTYNIAIGFPNQGIAEQRYNVSMKANDRGYLIKNFGDKGWGLFDIKTMAVIMSSAGGPSSISSEKMEVSPFTDILSKAADDESLKEKQVLVKKEEPKQAIPVSTITSPDPPVSKAEQPVLVSDKPKAKTDTVKSEPVTAVVKEPVVEIVKQEQPKEVLVKTEEKKEADKVVESRQETYEPSVVTKTSERQTNEGLVVTFSDKTAGKEEMISITIPGKPEPVEAVKTEAKEEKKFLDISSEADKPVVSNPVVKQNVEITKPAVVRNCKEVANENDFLKLRKKMVGETDDDDMVDEARKVFKAKCFTTTQIKNLGALFLDDLGKYKFYDMAYLFVSDVENFGTLEAELKNDYYKNRFKAMLK